MKETNIIETIGTIIKKELLATIEEGLAGGFMVLESKHPFPGYHGKTVPDDHELIPDSIFVVTKQNYEIEKIMRASHEVRRNFKKRFDAAPGYINIFNEMVSCIRIKYLKSYKDIADLLQLFQKFGIQLSKYKKVNPYDGLIKINKFFELEMLVPGLYLDHEDSDICYLQVPKNINWDAFEKITLDIKRNMEDNLFDAALATIFRKNCVVDCVRIYDHQIEREKIDKIKARYLTEIKKHK